MASVNSTKKNWEEMYTGFDSKEVGAGTINPNIYSNPDYAKKKTSTLLIGGLSQISYGGWEHDTAPLILTMHYVAAYNVLLAMNLHYVPEKIRHQIVQYILKTNKNRIKSNQPIIIDYNNMKRAIPVTSAIVRMYKLPLIRVIETYPLQAWGVAIDGKSKWDSHFKKLGNNENAFGRFKRSVSNFFK